MDELNLSKNWEGLQSRADKCTACAELTPEIACPRTSIGIAAPTNPVNCLFVSWNPPSKSKTETQASDNFWNNSSDILRNNLLGILKLKNTVEFLDKGFFLIHAVKCATKSPGTLQADSDLSKLVLGTCVPQYLEKEVKEVASPRICLLGAIAKEGFGIFCPDANGWAAKPTMGQSKLIKLSYGEVDCLYTCLPIYPRWIPCATEHLSKWL